MIEKSCTKIFHVFSFIIDLFLINFLKIGTYIIELTIVPKYQAKTALFKEKKF